MSKHRSTHGNIFPDDPTASDDCTSGFGVGFLWFNSVSEALWFCASTAPNAALWIKIDLATAAAGGGSAGSPLGLLLALTHSS